MSPARSVSRRLAVGVLLGLAPVLAFASGGAGTVDGTFGPDGDGILPLVPPFRGSGDPRLHSPEVEVDASGRMVVFARGTSGLVRDGAVVSDWRLRRYLADGTLDTSFADGGERAYFDAVRSGGLPAAFALDASGVWMAGRAWRSTVTGTGKRQKVVEEEVIQVVRVLAGGGASGDLDPAFAGGAPLVLGTLPVSSGLLGVGALLVRPSGGALVVGHGPVTTSSGGGKKGGASTTSWGVVVVAVRGDGTLDTSYGAGGWARHDLDRSTDGDGNVRGAVLQQDGALVVLTASHGMVRLGETGALDAAFGGGGVVEEPAPGALALARDAEDRLYVGGRDDATFVPEIRRYDADGFPDAAFGDGGVVVLQGLFGLAPHGLAVEEVAPGVRRLLIATGIDDVEAGGVVAVRLLLDGYAVSPGTRDPSFGPAGDGVGEPLRKIIDATTGETVGLWNAWDIVVHADGDVTVADAITSYEAANGEPRTVEASLGRIQGD